MYTTLFNTYLEDLEKDTRDAVILPISSIPAGSAGIIFISYLCELVRILLPA